LNYEIISSELSISTTPLRDALKQLAGEGFVVIKPRSGTYVNKPNVQDINDVYEVRHALELLALEKAFDHIKKNDIKQILKKIDKSNQLILKDDYQEYFKVDRETHSLWIKHSNNVHIIKIMNGLEGHIHWFSVLTTVNRSRAIESNSEHEAILQSILENNYEQAKQFLSEHIVGAQQIQIDEFGQIHKKNNS